MGSKIIINGTTIEGDVSGGITIRNGVVTIGGKTVNTGASGEVRLIVEGSCGSVECDGPVTVNGEVRGSIQAGSVTCGKVGGSIQAGRVTVQ